MSEMVHYKGKIELVKKLENETLEDTCKRILIDNGIKLEVNESYESYQEQIFDSLYEKYVVVNNEVYKVVEKKDFDDSDIFDIHDNGDGTYSYDVMYYNGGCCFEEAIEEAFGQ